MKMSTANVFPWDNTYVGDPFPDPYPSQPDWKQPWQDHVRPPVPQHPAELEAFEEFVIWACGFTDPENPPSQKKWEEFQKKVQQLAADFVAFKRAKREAERSFPPVSMWTTSATAKGQ